MYGTASPRAGQNSGKHSLAVARVNSTGSLRHRAGCTLHCGGAATLCPIYGVPLKFVGLHMNMGNFMGRERTLTVSHESTRS